MGPDPQPPVARHRLELEEPATRFVDRFLIGNGTLGTALDGVPGREGIDLSLDTLWSGGPTRPDGASPPRSAHSALASVRRAIASDDPPAADARAAALRGTTFTESFQPLGRLTVDYASPDDGARTRRTHDVARGVVETRSTWSGRAATLTAFVSAPDEVLVVEMAGDGVREPMLGFQTPHPSTTTEDAVGDIRWWSSTGRAPSGVRPSYLGGDDHEAVRYATDVPDADGLVDAGMAWALMIAVQPIPGGFRLVAGARSGHRGWNERPLGDPSSLLARTRTTVARALRRPADELLARHVADHRSLFDRVELDLSASASASADAAERYFDLGRSLLIGSSRVGGEPTNLQGVWNTQVRPPWSANFTTNINLQMAYWPAESTGLGGLAEPLARFIGELVTAGRSTARDAYGLAGAATHHNSDLWRHTDAVPLDAHWANWPSALPWLVAHLHRHLDDSAADHDAQVAVLRIVEPVVAFVLGMLVTDDDGSLVVNPSTSPENRFVVGMGTSAAVAAGATMDQELVHECLRDYLGLAERVGAGIADVDLVGRAQGAFDALRLPRIGHDGALLEWAEEHEATEPGHRHLSHLYGLYPGTRITETGTPEDFAAARCALRQRLEHGGGGTGWSMAWVLCLAARLREPELASHALDALLGPLSSASLLDLHPMGDLDAVFQIDGNLGGTAGVVELLVQGHGGVVSLLPTLPAAWSAGTFRGFRVRGAHVVDVEWRDHRPVAATLQLTAGDVIVELPDDGSTITIVGPHGPCQPELATGAPTGRRRIVLRTRGVHELAFSA
ncbi:glycoside hydrolase N-terminal domain-containing protein [Plantibacter sp. VKM Ac-2880]|uniref:glycosyl hydrolase family 95 catalytic domain-containing protein n=1 Tax=Plantibacter sp. VKM Ac-2880 TaxID=2783827 RepID=UPI00188F4B36|nr:glycoside hydrolase N-terminal domain-containing protein [Plantibacter sp. VKM Ac-2880]MBF4569153.1 glycoside hydrolase N-terminal domain-containing protein [Plantibacter sp. VKM Ac-2880]